MKKFVKVSAIFAQTITVFGLTSCSKKPYADDNEDIDISGAVKLQADFSTPSDPALLKKVDLYNAGCDPIEYYSRDMELCKKVHPSSLRCDVSIGKEDGNAGQYLVSDDYEIYDYDPTNETYKIDMSSLKYNFSDLDKLLGYFKEMNTAPYVSWSYIPSPLQDNEKFIRLNWNVTNWRECWEEIFYNYTKHYKDLGLKIGYHEIYNEPDLEILKIWGAMAETTQGFLDIDSFAPGGSPANGCYGDFYKYGVQGILRADPDATIGGPAFALGEIGVEDWVNFLPTVVNNNLPLDFYSFHTYLDGNTWFMSQEERDAGKKNEIEKVVDGMQSKDYYLKTAVHINEFSPLNAERGQLAGDLCDYNFYHGAGWVFDGICEAINRSSIQKINCSQLLSVPTSTNDPFGFIDRFGYPKACYNTLLMYQDMPVWRYTTKMSDENSGLKTLLSTSDDKISMIIYNSNAAKDADGNYITSGDRTAALSLKDPKFTGGQRRIYRVDRTHASHNDKTATDLIAAQNIVNLKGDEDYVWKGQIPAEGLVYITINKDKNAEDFNYDVANQNFANHIKTQYWYEDRYRDLKGSREEYEDYCDQISGSYSFFDERTWKTYLGLGSCAGNEVGDYKDQGVASCAVTVDSLPTNFRILLEKDQRARMLNRYSNLSVRIDFYDDATKTYNDSVVLHNGFYEPGVNPNEQDSRLASQDAYPWGTGKVAARDVKFSGNGWNVDLNTIAPASWLQGSKRAMISYTMRNTGANSRCTISLVK